MHDRRTLTLMIAMLILGTVPVSGQGCKWCVTPTKCDDVSETAAAECTERVGGPCSTNGYCFIIETDNDDDASAVQLAWSEAIESGVEVIRMETDVYGALPFIRIAPGILGAFNCEGRVGIVAIIHENGDIEYAAPEGAVQDLRVSDIWIQSVGFASLLETT